MSKTITKEQIEQRNREIDAAEAADQVAANAVKFLSSELHKTQTENTELRQFIYSLGFDWYEIKTLNPIVGWDANGSPETDSCYAQNSKCEFPNWIENAK